MSNNTSTDWARHLHDHLHDWYEQTDTSVRGDCDVYRITSAEFDRVLINFALQRSGGNISASAKLLGLSIGTLRARIRTLEIDLQSFRL